MDIINQNIQALLSAILQNEVYVEYKRQEANLRKQPELWQRAKQLRAENFRLQNDPSFHDNLFESVERLSKDVAELRKNPEVNAFLAAELALCRQLQMICCTITDAVDFETPEL